MIHYLFPYSTEKNIGKAYNEAIRSLKADPDDWIVIKDGDVAFLTPEWGRQIDHVSKTTDFDLLGCMTGRLNSKKQLVSGKFDTRINMFKNYEIALVSEKLHWGEVKEVDQVAGMFLMFRWNTWLRVGGFEEGTIRADIEFNKDVKRIGGKVGVIKGLYCFHAYRLWEPQHTRAANSFQHLK